MSEYKELLKHFGIKPELIVADMTGEESKYNKECAADCVVHKLATHNTCVFCSSCRNSPYYREDFLGKSDEEIEVIRKEVSEEL